MEDTNYKNPSPSQYNGEWKKPIREEFLELRKCIGEKFLDPCQNIYPCQSFKSIVQLQKSYAHLDQW